MAEVRFGTAGAPLAIMSWEWSSWPGCIGNHPLGPRNDYGSGFRSLNEDARRFRGLASDCNCDRLIAGNQIGGHGEIDLIQSREAGRQAAEGHIRWLPADHHGCGRLG